MRWRPLVQWGRWWVSGSWVSPQVYPALPPAGTECTVSSCAVVASYNKFQWKLPETLNFAPSKYQLAPRFKIVKHDKSVSLKNMWTLLFTVKWLIRYFHKINFPLFIILKNQLLNGLILMHCKKLICHNLGHQSMWVQLSFELFYLYTYLLFLFPIAMHKQKSKGSQ